MCLEAVTLVARKPRSLLLGVKRHPFLFMAYADSIPIEYRTSSESEPALNYAQHHVYIEIEGNLDMTWWAEKVRDPEKCV